jgi:hypothetical protein
VPENMQSQKKRPHLNSISSRLAHLDGVVLIAHQSGKAVA